MTQTEKIDAGPPANTKLRRVDWLAEQLDISKAQAYDVIAKKMVPAECVIRLGKRIRINEAKYNAWISGDLR